MSRIAVLILLSLAMFSLPVSAADTEAQKKAEDAFDSLYGADVKRVRATRDTADDAALAAKLLAAARAVEAQPEFLAILCTNACELAAADAKGYETAQAVCDLAIEKAPSAAGACQDTIVTMRRRQYDTARGDAKAQACDALIDALAASADTRLRGGDTEGAHARLLKAATLARQTRSQKADAVEAQLKTITARQKSAAEAERLKKQVEADPANAKARDPLVRLLVVDLDSPAEAAKYVDESSDATLKKFVPAAAQSDRPDHGPMGSYDGWPPLTMDVMCRFGAFDKAVNFLRAVEPVTHEGPFAQGHEFLGPDSRGFDPVVRIANRGGQDFNEECGAAFAEVIIRSFFGYRPDLSGAGLPLLAPRTRRGFNGQLRHVPFHGGLYTIRSDAQGIHQEKE